jgi:hypothetical protein
MKKNIELTDAVTFKKVYSFVERANSKYPNLINNRKDEQDTSRKLDDETVIPLDDVTKSGFELAHDTTIEKPLLHYSAEMDDYLQRARITALTIGKNIFVDSRKYKTGSEETRQILEHELTHVQQNSEKRNNVPADELEAEAYFNENAVLRNGEPIKYIEIKGEYYPTTEKQYRKMIYETAREFCDEVESKSRSMQEKDRLNYLCGLQEWLDSDGFKSLESCLNRNGAW